MRNKKTSAPHGLISLRWIHLAGWRIYEGGGGVKGILVVLCYVSRASSPPQVKPGGCERSDTSARVPVHVPHSKGSELPLTHLSGHGDQDVD
ncbi:MAG TPA: hypothetical protein VFD30_01410, partial [Terriglobia bacterium]|nr:hypothetical protein [Terriglobia bacterium]